MGNGSTAVATTKEAAAAAAGKKLREEKKVNKVRVAFLHLFVEDPDPAF